MWHPQIDRYRSLIQIDSKFSEDVVAEVDPGAGKGETGVARCLAGGWLFSECAELTGLLSRQIRPQADEEPALLSSHFRDLISTRYRHLCGMPHKDRIRVNATAQLGETGRSVAELLMGAVGSTAWVSSEADLDILNAVRLGTKN